VVRTQVMQMFNVSTRIQNKHQKDAMQRGLPMLHIFQNLKLLKFSSHILPEQTFKLGN